MSKIYGILSTSGAIAYVGSTKREPSKRLAEHTAKRPKNLCELLDSSHVLVELEEVDHADRFEREAFHIQRLKWEGFQMCNINTPNNITRMGGLKQYMKDYKQRNNKQRPCPNCGRYILASNMAAHKRTMRCVATAQNSTT